MAGTARKGEAIAEDADIVGEKLGPKGGQSGARPQQADLLGLASDVASDLAGTAVQQGRQILQSAKGEATGFVDARKNDAAQSIADIAASLRETGNGFEDRPNIKTFVASAADGLDQLAGGIRERSFAEIYAEAESFARRQPVLVGAAAIAAGFLLARFIKSSAEELAETNARTVTERSRGAARRRTGLSEGASDA